MFRVGFAIMSQQIVLPIERSGTPRLHTFMSDNAMRRLKVSCVVSFSVVQTLPFENGMTTFYRTMKLDIFLKRNFCRRRIGMRGLIKREYRRSHAASRHGPSHGIIKPDQLASVHFLEVGRLTNVSLVVTLTQALRCLF